MFLCPWDSPGKKTSVGYYRALLQESNPRLLRLLCWHTGSLPLAPCVDHTSLSNFSLIFDTRWTGEFNTVLYMTILLSPHKITNGDSSYLLHFLNSVQPQAVALTPPPCWAFFQFNGQCLDFFLHCFLIYLFLHCILYHHRYFPQQDIISTFNEYTSLFEHIQTHL